MSYLKFNLCTEARQIVDYEDEQALREEEAFQKLSIAERSDLFWARYDAEQKALEEVE